MASPDDIYFDDENAEKLVAENTLKKLRETHFVGGLKEGIGIGKELALEKGFNYGYQIGLNKSKRIGKLRGRLSALLLKIEETESESETTEKEKIRALLTELENLESKQMKEIREVLRQQDTSNITCTVVGNFNTNDQEFEDLFEKCTQLLKTFQDNFNGNNV